MSDLLAQTPGVAVTRNGGIGAATALRIRGAEADQTVVIVDGVKLNDPSSVGGGYNFGNLLAGDVGRIEVLRGAQSTLWGSQAIGGVIHLTSAVPASSFESSASLEGGSRESFSAKATTGGAMDRITWRLAASRTQTEGISAAAAGIERDGYRNTGLSGRVNASLTEDLSADLRAIYSRGRNEFDGFPPPLFALGDTRQYGVTRDFVGYAGLNLDTSGGGWTHRVAYTQTDTDRDDFNLDQAIAPRTFDGRGKNRRGEFQGTVRLPQDWTATYGVEYESSRIRTVSPSPFALTPPLVLARRVHTAGGYAQATGDLAPGLSLTAGVRHEDHQTFGGHTAGQGAVAWSLNSGATVVRASFGQGFKAPTLFQLYSIFGTLALKPEQADAWDAGVEHRAGPVTVSATVFGRKVRNQIDFFVCSTATAQCVGRFGFYDNVARAKAIGFESSAAMTIDQLTIDANYTLTDTKNTSPGNPNRGKTLARRPRHTGNVNADYRWPLRISTGIGARYVGSSFDNAANTVVLKDHVVVDFRAAWELRDGVELYGRVENLFDERYANAAGYGQPGRGVFAGFRSRF